MSGDMKYGEENTAIMPIYHIAAWRMRLISQRHGGGKRRATAAAISKTGNGSRKSVREKEEGKTADDRHSGLCYFLQDDAAPAERKKNLLSYVMTRRFWPLSHYDAVFRTTCRCVIFRC